MEEWLFKTLVRLLKIYMTYHACSKKLHLAVRMFSISGISMRIPLPRAEIRHLLRWLHQVPKTHGGRREQLHPAPRERPALHAHARVLLLQPFQGLRLLTGGPPGAALGQGPWGLHLLQIRKRNGIRRMIKSTEEPTLKSLQQANPRWRKKSSASNKSMVKSCQMNCVIRTLRLHFRVCVLYRSYF